MFSNSFSPFLPFSFSFLFPSLIHSLVFFFSFLLSLSFFIYLSIFFLQSTSIGNILCIFNILFTLPQFFSFLFLPSRLPILYPSILLSTECSILKDGSETPEREKLSREQSLRSRRGRGNPLETGPTREVCVREFKSVMESGVMTVLGATTPNELILRAPRVPMS